MTDSSNHYGLVSPYGDRSRSTLVQGMACLTVPSHYRNQCWLIKTALDCICLTMTREDNFTGKSSVAKRTNHGAWPVLPLSGLYDVVNELLPDHRSPLSKLHKVIKQRKIFWKFISRKTDYFRFNYGSPILFMGRIWRPSLDTTVLLPGAHEQLVSNPLTLQSVCRDG